MAQRIQASFDPRKSPLQARSAASVEAILEATIQVLLQDGKERLTTTKVASRAGVSVGTLYQYFPNKSALLQAALRRHLEAVLMAVDLACRQQRGKPLAQMATALVHAFLDAKMRHPKTSAALYAVSSDVDGARISRQIGMQWNKAIVDMLSTASDELTKRPEVVASMLQGVMTGVSRTWLESADAQKHFDNSREELIELVCAYMNTCSVRRTVDRADSEPVPIAV